MILMMKMIQIELVFLGILSSVVTFSLGSKCSGDFKPPYLLCYYTGDTSLNEVNYNDCTHLIFTNVVAKNVSDGGLRLKKEVKNNLSIVKENNTNLITVVTLNLVENAFSDNFKSENKSKRLIEDITSLMQENDFDGIELNFEFETLAVGGTKESHTNFVKNLHESINTLHRRKKRNGYEVAEEQEDDAAEFSYLTHSPLFSLDSQQFLLNNETDEESIGQEQASEELEENTTVYEEKEEDGDSTPNGTGYLTRIPSIWESGEEGDEEEEKDKEEEEEEDDDEDLYCNKYWLIVRLPIKNDVVGKKFDLKALSRYSDLLTVSTHKIVNENGNGVAYHPSRLMGLWDAYNTDSIVDFLLSLGADKSKLVISLPAFVIGFRLNDSTENVPGSRVTSGPLIYNQSKLCSLFRNKNWTLEREEDLTAPYAYSGDTWLAFEDETSADVKSKYILLRELAGGAVYTIDADLKGRKCTNFFNVKGQLTSALAKNFKNYSRKSRAAVLETLQDEIHEDGYSNVGADGVRFSDFRIVRVVDRLGAVHAVRKNTKTQFQCSRQGFFAHPLGCNRFYRCVKFDQYSDDFTVFEYDCPEGLAFDERWEVCVWPGSLPNGSPCTGSSEIAPIPRSRFRCPRQEGYYGDPENCRWFFACLDHARDGITPLTAYEFRCPFGLVFNEEKLICDWPWGVKSCGLSSRGNGYVGSSSAIHTTFYDGGNSEVFFGQHGKNVEQTPFGLRTDELKSSFKNGLYKSEIGRGNVQTLTEESQTNFFNDEESQRNSFVPYKNFKISNGRKYKIEKFESEKNENFGIDFKGSADALAVKTTASAAAASAEAAAKGSLQKSNFQDFQNNRLNKSPKLTNKEAFKKTNLGSDADASGPLLQAEIEPIQLFKLSSYGTRNNYFGRSENPPNHAISRGFSSDSKSKLRNDGFYETVTSDVNSQENQNFSDDFDGQAFRQEVEIRQSNLNEETRKNFAFPSRTSEPQNASNYAQYGNAKALSDSTFRPVYQQSSDTSKDNLEFTTIGLEPRLTLAKEIQSKSRDSTVSTSVAVEPSVAPVSRNLFRENFGFVGVTTPATAFDAPTSNPFSYYSVQKQSQFGGNDASQQILHTLPSFGSTLAPNLITDTENVTRIPIRKLIVPATVETLKFKNTLSLPSFVSHSIPTVLPTTSGALRAKTVGDDSGGLVENSAYQTSISFTGSRDKLNGHSYDVKEDGFVGKSPEELTFSTGSVVRSSSLKSTKEFDVSSTQSSGLKSFETSSGNSGLSTSDSLKSLKNGRISTSTIANGNSGDDLLNFLNNVLEKKTENVSDNNSNGPSSKKATDKINSNSYHAFETSSSTLNENQNINPSGFSGAPGTDASKELSNVHKELTIDTTFHHFNGLPISQNESTGAVGSVGGTFKNPSARNFLNNTYYAPGTNVYENSSPSAELLFKMLNLLRSEFEKNTEEESSGEPSNNADLRTPAKPDETFNSFKKISKGSLATSSVSTTSGPYVSSGGVTSSHAFGGLTGKSLFDRKQSSVGLFEKTLEGSSKGQEDTVEALKSSFGGNRETYFSVTRSEDVTTPSSSPSRYGTFDVKKRKGSVTILGEDTSKYSEEQYARFENDHYGQVAGLVKHQTADHPHGKTATEFVIPSKSTFGISKETINTNQKSGLVSGLRFNPEANGFENRYSSGFIKTEFQPTFTDFKGFTNTNDVNLFKQSSSSSSSSSEKSVESNENSKDIFKSLDMLRPKQSYGEAIGLVNPSDNHDSIPTIYGESPTTASNFEHVTVDSTEKTGSRDYDDFGVKTEAKTVGEDYRLSSVELSTRFQRPSNDLEHLRTNDHGLSKTAGRPLKIVIPDLQPPRGKTLEKHHEPYNGPQRHHPTVEVAKYETEEYKDNASTEKTSLGSHRLKNLGVLNDERVEGVTGRPNVVATIPTQPSITTFLPKINQYGQSTTAQSTSNKFRSEHLEPVIRDRAQLLGTKFLTPVVRNTYSGVNEKPIVFGEENVQRQNVKGDDVTILRSFVTSTEVPLPTFGYPQPKQVDDVASIKGEVDASESNKPKLIEPDVVITEPVNHQNEFNSYDVKENDQHPLGISKSHIAFQQVIKPYSQTSSYSTTGQVNHHQESIRGNYFDFNKDRINDHQTQDLLLRLKTNEKTQFPLLQEPRKAEISSSKLKLPAPVVEHRPLSTETSSVEYEFQKDSLNEHPLEFYDQFFQSNDTRSSTLLTSDDKSNSNKPVSETYPSLNKYAFGGNESPIGSDKIGEGLIQNIKFDDSKNAAYFARDPEFSQEGILERKPYGATISGGYVESEHQNRHESEESNSYGGRYQKVTFGAKQYDGESKSKDGGQNYENLYLKSLKNNGGGRLGNLLDGVFATNKYEEYDIEKDVQSFGNDVSTKGFVKGHENAAGHDNNKGIVVSQTSKANPVLVEKLAGQCSCRSNTLDLKNGRRNSGNRKNNNEKRVNLKGNFDGEGSFDGGVESKSTPETIEYDVLHQYSSTTSNYQPAESASVDFKVGSTEDETLGKKKQFRGKAKFLWPSSFGPRHSGSDISLPSLISAYHIVNAENGGYHAEESRTQNEIGEGQFKIQDFFDRYGPGGWRALDETLQGSVDCQRPGLFRHPKHCSKFYACNYDPWEERFTLHVFNCPIRLTYDSSISACNWPVGGPSCANDNLLV